MAQRKETKKETKVWDFEIEKDAKGGFSPRLPRLNRLGGRFYICDPIS